MADRIGVINKGELILVEDKAVLMRKLGKKQLTLQLQAPLERIPEALADLPLELADDGQRWSTPSTRRREETGIAALLRRLARARHRLQGPAFQRELARGDLRQPGARTAARGARMNVARDPRDLPLRDGAHVPHADAEHRLAGAVDVAVLRRVRRGDRLAHGRGRRRQLRRLHHPRPDHAVAAEREHLQRLVRHLHAEVGRHDLRTAVGAGVVRRGRDRLRRRGGDQVGDARHADPGHRARVRAVRDRASVLDGCASWC